MEMIRVTQPLSVYADFSHIPNDVLQNAARRGTAVHSACAAYADGLFIPPLEDDVAGFFDSFTAWFDMYVERVYFVEEELADPTLGFYGHPDIGCRLVDGRNMIIDYKTPVAASKTWAPQTSAYLHLARLNRSEPYDGSMVLQPRKDGKPAKATTYQYHNEAFSIFLSALNAYRYFKVS